MPPTKQIDTMTEDALDTAEGPRPGVPKGRVRIRALRPTFWRHKRQFKQEGEVFDAAELGWTPEQWKAAKADKMLLIEENVRE